jgi:hypothetical protein
MIVKTGNASVMMMLMTKQFVLTNVLVTPAESARYVQCFIPAANVYIFVLFKNA